MSGNSDNSTFTNSTLGNQHHHRHSRWEKDNWFYSCGFMSKSWYEKCKLVQLLFAILNFVLHLLNMVFTDQMTKMNLASFTLVSLNILNVFLPIKAGRLFFHPFIQPYFIGKIFVFVDLWPGWLFKQPFNQAPAFNQKYSMTNLLHTVNSRYSRISI